MLQEKSCDPPPLRFSGFMYLVLVTFGLLAGFVVARWLVEPACPACSAKSWNDQPSHLECTRCGWSNAVTPVKAKDPVATGLVGGPR